MAEALDFDFKSAGFYSSLPHLARFIAGFGFGWIGDYLRRRKMSPTLTRKYFCILCKESINEDHIINFSWQTFFIHITILAHIIPGLLLLTIPFIKESGIVVAILVFSLGFNGAAVLTNLQVSISPLPSLIPNNLHYVISILIIC